jgi:hypothetical protein
MEFAGERRSSNFENRPVDGGGKAAGKRAELQGEKNLFSVEHFWYWRVLPG